MNFLDGPKHAGADHRGGLAQRSVARALVAHLRGDFHFAGDLAQLARFLDGARERLLREGGLAEPHGHGGGRGVHVIGSAHGDRIDAAGHLVEHLAKVVVLGGVREALGAGLFQRVVVDVADGHDVARTLGVGRVAGALAAHADAGKADHFVGRLAVFRSRGARDKHTHAGQRRALQKPSTIGQVGHGTTLLVGWIAVGFLTVARRKENRVARRARMLDIRVGFAPARSR